MLLDFPAGLTEFTGPDGVKHKPDANGQVEVAAGDLGPFLAQGFLPDALALVASVAAVAASVAALAVPVAATAANLSALEEILGNPTATPANHIGIPGAAGFGLGICPSLPAGFTPLAGYTYPTSANYGNYVYADGSVMCWVPKFYYKYGTGSNGLPVNWVDIQPASVYADTAAANAAGYALHRAFIDGGVEKAGFMFDKYMVSKVAKGSGYVGASIKNGWPLSTSPDHNPMWSNVPGTGLTACGANLYSEAINAAHARDGVDGAINAASIFHVPSRFQYAALALLSLAHGLAAKCEAWCAWYDWTGAKNYPKGCNNSALRDADDTTVVYLADGYSNCGKTGSGFPFAKTTHNGQECGIADLNGLMWEISLGITCIAASKTIASATKANPCVIEVTAHGYSTGNVIMIANVVGMTQLNDKLYAITVDPGNPTNKFSLDGVNSSAYSDFTSGANSVTKGTFYAAKQGAAMKDFTPGNTGATDHWGATGVAAKMDAFAPQFVTAGGGPFAQRYGNAFSQVLSEEVSGAAWLLAGLGLPYATTGLSSGGDNLFGKDYFCQSICNELCPISCAAWSNASYAGVWSLYWSHSRMTGFSSAGWRCACYP